jgi:hypothetical protein
MQVKPLNVYNSFYVNETCMIQPLNAHHCCTQGLVLHPEDVPVFPTISTFAGIRLPVTGDCGFKQ